MRLTTQNNLYVITRLMVNSRFDLIVNLEKGVSECVNHELRFHFQTYLFLFLFTPFGVLDTMSLAINSALIRFKPTLKTLFTVGTYMGCGDLLCQKVALKREKLY